MCQHLHQELRDHIKHEASLQKESNMMKKLLMGAIIALILSVIATFASVIIGTEVTKEVKTDAAGHLVTTSGTIMQTNAAEYMVEDGQLKVRPQQGSRVLAQCPENVTCKDTGATTLQTQSKPLTVKTLSSSVPDEFLNELKQLKLSNVNKESITLQITSYSRKITSNSKCGTLLIFETAHGSLHLDDFDIVLSETLKGFLRESDFDFSESMTASGRRLSAGHDIVGLFNFFMEYEWKCESYARPLAGLMPPYQFEIQTRVLCPGDCTSSVFTNYLLPGMVKEKSLPYIALHSKVFAFDNVVVTLEEWPSHPGITMMTYSNPTENITKKRVSTLGVMHSCSETGIPAAEDFLKQFENYHIVVVGDTVQNNTQYRRYQIVPKNAVSDDERRHNTVEFWETSVSEKPYKYFMPMVGSASITYFQSFSKDVSAELADSLLKSFTDTCESDVGPDTKKDGFFAEVQDTLEWYKQQFQAMPQLLEDIPESYRDYWIRVKDMYVEKDSARKRRMQSLSSGPLLGPAPQAAVAHRSDIVSPKKVETFSEAGQLATLASNASSRQLQPTNNLNEFQQCRFNFKIGSFEIKICELYMTGADNPFKWKGIAEAEDIWVGPFVFGATGEATLDLAPSICCPTGKIEVTIGLGVKFVVFEASLRIKGSLEFAPGSVAPHAKLIAELGLLAKAKILGIDLELSVMGSMFWIIDNLGSSFATISWTYEVAFEFSILIFTVKIPWSGTIIDKKPLTPDVGVNSVDGDAGAWTEFCACGDVTKCGHIAYCNNWATRDGGFCNEGGYEYAAYDWDDKVNCSNGYKRCFCKQKAVKKHSWWEWSPCYRDNWGDCHTDRMTCVRNYCTSQGMVYDGSNWRDCGSWHFSGRCEKQDWSPCYHENQCSGNRDTCISDYCQTKGLKYTGAHWKDCGNWRFQGMCEHDSWYDGK
eukprot:TRINITY_DN10262_c0_g1_i2.p1 TRINITY_DN10262_c0_g1~~TRINITY_DN10262_c0_g1_i2.p1  ORF type:complete len:1018 (+),score=186.30 TRINITY_DN10262_c0_g1_i2:264-3056(+)